MSVAVTTPTSGTVIPLRASTPKGPANSTRKAIQMATGFGVEELPRGVGGVHDGLIAAAGGCLLLSQLSPAPRQVRMRMERRTSTAAQAFPHLGKSAITTRRHRRTRGPMAARPWCAGGVSRPGDPAAHRTRRQRCAACRPAVGRCGRQWRSIGSVPPPPSGSGGLTTGAGAGW